MSNNGHDDKCCFCGKEGHTAHDLTWNPTANGWLCDECEYNADDYFRDYPPGSAAARAFEDSGR